MALSATVTNSIVGTITNSLDLQEQSSALTSSDSLSLTDGTGANQANNVFSDQRTLAASANEELDLAGSLTDAYGSTITFTKVKALKVSAASGNTNSVNVGGAAANGFINWVGDATDVIKIPPGGTFLITAPDATGFAVTAGTGDLLKITNGGGSTSVTYDIVIIGVE